MILYTNDYSPSTARWGPMYAFPAAKTSSPNPQLLYSEI